LQKRIELGIECHRKGTVDDATIDVRTEIDFHHIAVLENRVITGIRGVMGSNVVDTTGKVSESVSE
jgi:hypothetical protein